MLAAGRCDRPKGVIVDKLTDLTSPVVLIAVVLAIVVIGFVYRRRRRRPFPPEGASGMVQADADYLDSSHIISGPLPGAPPVSGRPGRKPDT